MATSQYQLVAQQALSLSPREQLQLIKQLAEQLLEREDQPQQSLINDLALRRTVNGEKKQSGEKLSDLFGSVSLDYPTGVNNEQIDADLAREYANMRGEE